MALVDYESLRSPKLHYSREPAAEEPSFLGNVRLEERMCEDAASNSNKFTRTDLETSELSELHVSVSFF